MTHQNRKHPHKASLLLIPLLLAALPVLPSGALADGDDPTDPLKGEVPTVVEQSVAEKDVGTGDILQAGTVVLLVAAIVGVSGALWRMEA